MDRHTQGNDGTTVDQGAAYNYNDRLYEVLACVRTHTM